VLRTYSATGRPPQGIRRPRWSAVIGGDPPRRADCGAHRSACLSGIHWDADCPHCSAERRRTRTSSATVAFVKARLQTATASWISSSPPWAGRRDIAGPGQSAADRARHLVPPDCKRRFRSNGGCLHGTVRQRRDIWDGRCETHDDVMQSERNRLIPTRIYSAAATR